MSQLERSKSPSTVTSMATRFAALAALGVGLHAEQAIAQPNPSVQPQALTVGQQAQRDYETASGAFAVRDYETAYRIFTRLYQNPETTNAELGFNVMRTSGALLDLNIVGDPLALPRGQATEHGHRFTTSQAQIATNRTALTLATTHNVASLTALSTISSINVLTTKLTHLIPTLRIADQLIRADLEGIRQAAVRGGCNMPAFTGNTQLRELFSNPTLRACLETATGGAREENLLLSNIFPKLGLYRDFINAYYLIANRIHELNPSADIPQLGIERPLFMEHLVAVVPFTPTSRPGQPIRPVVTPPVRVTPPGQNPHPRNPVLPTPATSRWVTPASLSVLGAGVVTSVVGGIVAAGGASGQEEAVAGRDAIERESLAIARTRPLTQAEITSGNARLATLHQQHIDATSSVDNGTIAMGVGLGLSAVGAAGFIYGLTRPSHTTVPATTIRQPGQRSETDEGTPVATGPQWTVTPTFGRTTGAQLTITF